jgi:L-lactate dehydrogenase complex protein LldG
VSGARSAILARVRRAVETGRIPAASGPAAHALVIAPPVHDPAALRERFVRELSALGVATYSAASAEDVCAHVRDIVGTRPVFSWDGERLPYGAAGALGPGAITASADRDAQARAEIGVTGCHGAIAETGSIAVLSGPGTPRAASLLPPVHLCLVRTADLYPSIGAFFEAKAEVIAEAACCTFISGPSRTADIELTLTVGVHGPREVIVVVGP